MFNNSNQVNNSKMATNEIVFVSDVEPVGFQTYFIKMEENLAKK